MSSVKIVDIAEAKMSSGVGVVVEGAEMWERSMLCQRDQAEVLSKGNDGGHCMVSD